MKRISHGTRHLPVTCHISHLSVGRNHPFRNTLHRLIYSLGRIIGNQRIALRNHILYRVIRNGSIKNNRTPMLLVLMISRLYRRVCLSPEVPPLRVHLDIHIDISVPFIHPQERLFASVHSHKLPVLIMKRSLLIGVRK